MRDTRMLQNTDIGPGSSVLTEAAAQNNQNFQKQKKINDTKETRLHDENVLVATVTAPLGTDEKDTLQEILKQCGKKAFKRSKIAGKRQAEVKKQNKLLPPTPTAKLVRQM